jgi:amidase
LVAFEAGSDSAGSLRVPAHYCGVYGHRPTYGIVPQTGHELGNCIAPRDLSTLGPMARTAEDLGLVLDVMSGPDQMDAASWTLALPQPTRRAFSEMRVAVMLDSAGARVDADTRAQLRKVADFLAERGAKVVETGPDLDAVLTTLTFLRLLRSAGSAGLSDAGFHASLELANASSRDVSNYRIDSARAETMGHRDWFRPDEIRHRIRRTWAEFFKSWDVLICPVSSTPATPHDHVSKRWEQTIEVDGDVLLATDQLFWVGFSALAYLPSTVAPLGLSTSGLPIGMQIIGAQGNDRQCIAFAGMLERAYRSFVAPPAFA